VRKDEKRNRVRITAQLVNVEDGYHLWSETYDRDLNDIFAIQEEIARKVATALKVTLLGEDEERIATKAVTDISAYDLYLRGLQQLNTHSYAAIKQAISTFDQVLEKDPGYTPSAINLAKAWLDLAYTGAVSQAEAIDKSQPLLSSILAKDAANSDAHVLMARIMWAKKDRTKREQQLRMALDDDPRNVDALREMSRYLYFENGNVEKGLEYIQEAERIDPYSVDVLWDLISLNAFMMQPEIAKTYAERIAEIQPESPNRYWGPGLAYLVSGKMATALDYQIKGANLDPNDYEFKAGIASTWLALGDIEQAELWAKQADAIGADQPYPIMARVMMYQYREQYGLAADMAKRALDRKLDNRLGTENVLRRAYISDLVRRGDITQAIDFYNDHLPGAFTTPLALDLESYRTAHQLIDIALLLQMREPGSTRAVELIDAAEQKMQLRDERFLPWARARDRAAVAAARNNKQAALEQLQQAVELGLRWRWQSTLFTTIAFNSLHDEPDFKQLVSRLEEDMQRQREQAYQIPGVLQ
jgi:tetratricopeptide (TPR) repeat protein